MLTDDDFSKLQDMVRQTVHASLADVKQRLDQHDELIGAFTGQLGTSTVPPSLSAPPETGRLTVKVLARRLEGYFLTIGDSLRDLKVSVAKLTEGQERLDARLTGVENMQREIKRRLTVVEARDNRLAIQGQLVARDLDPHLDTVAMYATGSSIDGQEWRDADELDPVF